MIFMAVQFGIWLYIYKPWNLGKNRQGQPKNYWAFFQVPTILFSEVGMMEICPWKVMSTSVLFPQAQWNPKNHSVWSVVGPNLWSEGQIHRFHRLHMSQCPIAIFCRVRGTKPIRQWDQGHLPMDTAESASPTKPARVLRKIGSRGSKWLKWLKVSQQILVIMMAWQWWWSWNIMKVWQLSWIRSQKSKLFAGIVVGIAQRLLHFTLVHRSLPLQARMTIWSKEE